MAEEESRASLSTLLRHFVGPAFWRIGRWGVAATAAVSLALLIGNSDMGARRIALAFSNTQGSPSATVAVPRELVPRDNGEMMRLSEQLRQMTSEQNRLYGRLEKLERNLEDLTGSIAMNSKPPRPAEMVAPPPPESIAPPQTIPSKVVPQSNAPIGSSVPVQDAAPPDAPPANKVDFGIDLGSAPTVEALRTLWMSVKGKHAVVLEGLRPIVTIRETAKPGGVELRLVVGPVASAALAARMCVVIIATGSICQPAVFDGQRLAMR